MILMPVRDDEADEVALDLLGELRIGQDDLDARPLRLGEGEAAVDHQPFAPAPRAEAVEREVHADLAQPAKRYENQFVGLIHQRTLSMAQYDVAGLDRDQ